MARVIRSARVESEPLVLTYSPPPQPDRLFVMQPEPQLALPEPAPREDERATLEALRREAFDEGYRDGRGEGEKDARAEHAAELQTLQALARSVRDALGQGIEGVEDALVEIAFAAVCKVLGRAAASEEGVRAMVREAMSEVRSRDGVVLRVSPASTRRSRGSSAPSSRGRRRARGRGRLPDRDDRRHARRAPRHPAAAARRYVDAARRRRAKRRRS